jgi:hypothetical protein
VRDCETGIRWGIETVREVDRVLLIFLSTAAAADRRPTTRQCCQTGP